MKPDHRSLCFSVVVPTYNRKQTLRRCLNALVAQDYNDFEVIVVDDGSTDGTGNMVTSEFPGVHYLVQENRGPAAARNAGIRAAKGDIIAFTDDDCLPDCDWLSKLNDGYLRNPLVVGVGGYLQPPDAVLKSEALARYEALTVRRVYHVSSHEYVGGFECPSGGTNNMSYKRTVLETVGGFDNSFPFAAGEDADLKWRVCAAGAQLLFVPVRMTHLHTYSWDTFKRQCYVRGQGAICFDRKHRKASRSRSIARLIRRCLSSPIRALDAEWRPYGLICLAEAWFNFGGEWDMLKVSR